MREVSKSKDLISQKVGSLVGKYKSASGPGQRIRVGLALTLLGLISAEDSEPAVKRLLDILNNLES